MQYFPVSDLPLLLPNLSMIGRWWTNQKPVASPFWTFASSLSYLLLLMISGSLTNLKAPSPKMSSSSELSYWHNSSFFSKSQLIALHTAKVCSLNLKQVIDWWWLDHNYKSKHSSQAIFFHAQHSLAPHAIQASIITPQHSLSQHASIPLHSLITLSWEVPSEDRPPTAEFRRPLS